MIDRALAYQLSASVAVAAWLIAAVSCVQQKMKVDDAVNGGPFGGVSLEEAQRLQDALIGHVLTCLVVALAFTVPLAVVAAHRP